MRSSCRLKREIGSNSRHQDISGKLGHDAVSSLAPRTPKHRKAKKQTLMMNKTRDRRPPLGSPARSESQAGAAAARAVGSPRPAPPLRPGAAAAAASCRCVSAGRGPADCAPPSAQLPVRARDGVGARMRSPVSFPPSPTRTPTPAFGAPGVGGWAGEDGRVRGGERPGLCGRA